MTAVTYQPGVPATTHWDAYAACLGMDGELWFPASHQTSTGRTQTEAAIRICRSCLVQGNCLEAALQEEGTIKAESREGIRGGYTPAERFNIYRARYRAERSAA